MTRPTHLVAETTHFRVPRTGTSFSVRWTRSGAMPHYMAVSAKALAELSVACWLAGVPVPEWSTPTANANWANAAERRDRSIEALTSECMRAFHLAQVLDLEVRS